MDYKKLEELNNLRQAGALTEEEFEREKQKLFAEDCATEEKAAQLPLGIDETAYLALVNFLLLIPTIGWIASIILWIIGRPGSEKLNRQGKYIFNWLITWILIGIILTFAWILSLTTASIGIIHNTTYASGAIGIMILILITIALCLLTLIFPIIGGIKGLNGDTWKYPVSIPFLK